MWEGRTGDAQDGKRTLGAKTQAEIRMGLEKAGRVWVNQK